jgi:8-oxo-dGTP pyrophosphatase MutT (NUDIX family)
VSSATAGPAAGNIRPAASLIVLRDSPAGVEVLLMRRPERGNDFRSGACVFPGGVVDAADAGLHGLCFGLDDAAASRRLGEPSNGLDFFVAAVRECFEEAGLLFACRPDGSPADLASRHDELRAWRGRLHRGAATLCDLCAALDLKLDLRETAYFAHWLTPVVRPKRFDTRFFVRLAPPGQQAEPDFGEALELMWLTPAEALDPARGLKLLNVTQRTLQELSRFATAQAAYDAALARRGVQRILPRPVRSADGSERFVIPGMPAYDEVEALDPEGRGHVAGELVPGQCTRLTPRLLRVAGARRHAYLVTDRAGTAAALVDADPDDPAQWAALHEAAPTGVNWLLATGATPPPAAVRAQWPVAQAAAVAATLPEITLGADTRLRAVPFGQGHSALLLVEDGIVLGGDAIAAATEPSTEAVAPARAAGARWFAGARGFLRRIAPAALAAAPPGSG